VLGLTIVLPDGTIVHNCGGGTSGGALKSSAGYDMTRLMIGSEGTLGVITNVTVKLHPIPQFSIIAVCSFPTLKQAAQAVTALKLWNIPLERCELLDSVSVTAFQHYNRNHNRNDNSNHNANPNQNNLPTLFLELTGPTENAVQELLQLTQQILCTDEYNGSNFQYHSEQQQRHNLWKARHQLYYATLALRPGATRALITDACVPMSQFARLISTTAQDVQSLQVVGPCFGHAGDGNFHCIMPLLEHDSQDYLDRVHEVNHNLLQRTMDVGGTCTGEHGIGYGKISYLQQQCGHGGIHMMNIIKQSLDPHHIMNPGKILHFTSS